MLNPRFFRVSMTFGRYNVRYAVQAIHHLAIHHLAIHRMFDPKRAILVKRRDPVFGLYKLLAALVGVGCYEIDDRLFGRAVVP